MVMLLAWVKPWQYYTTIDALSRPYGMSDMCGPHPDWAVEVTSCVSQILQGCNSNCGSPLATAVEFTNLTFVPLNTEVLFEHTLT